MASSILIEEESGTTTGRRHPHNGYWAGDFDARSQTRPRATATVRTTRRVGTLPRTL